MMKNILLFSLIFAEFTFANSPYLIDTKKQVQQNMNKNQQDVNVVKKESGASVEKDIGELEKIAKENPYMPDINYMIGIYYMAGDVKKNIKPDFIKAMYYLKKDENNNAIANYKIGELYYYGYGVKQDYKIAISYFKKATEKNFKDYKAVAPIATLAISQVYIEKLHEYENAIPFLMQAANEFNKPEAQMNLAFLYIEGKGIEKNEEEANKWINKAYFNKDTTADMKAYMSSYIESTNTFDIESDVKNSCGMLK